MAARLSEEQVNLLREPHIAQVVTLMKDGSPQISPVWVDTDGENVVVNVQEGRVKLVNLRRDPRVAVSVYDADNPYTRVVNVRGTVVEVTRDGADEHIDFLSEKYTGKRPYAAYDPHRPRTIIKIRPDSVY